MEMWSSLKDEVTIMIGAIGSMFSVLWWFGKRTVIKMEAELKEVRKEVIQLDKRQSVSESHIDNIKEGIERVEESIQKSEENIKAFIRDLMKASR